MVSKEHIIKEIHRTTKENNGIPLGMARFEKEIGIKKSDWFGKYWARWNDAIKEAGYEPNKMQSGYDENWLIEQMISLVRELKRFPSGGDIRMKAYKSKEFPGHSTIESRLGNKATKVQKIMSHCKQSPDEYQDVIDICNPILDSSKNISEKASKETDVEFGYVYLMKSGRYYKIGRSDCVGRREYDIGIKLPEELKTIHKIRTKDPTGIEAYWHRRFEGKRKKGEWFDLTASDIKEFKSMKFI